MSDLQSQIDQQEDEDEQMTRKRKSVESDEEGDADAAMDDAEGASHASDESDPAVRRKKKAKHSRPGARFIDDIAVNEDDPEEEDEEESDGESEQDDGYDDDPEESDRGDGEADDGEDLEGGGRRKKGKKGRRGLDLSGEDETMHMAIDQQRDRREMDAMAREIEERYKNARYDPFYDEAGANRASAGAIIPSMRDPRLFLIRLGKGENADEIVWRLLQLFYKRELEGVESRRLAVHSVFTTPASKGYVYVEAWKSADVDDAVAALRAQGRAIWSARGQKKENMVPLSQMIATLQFSAEYATVKPKQWVRFKRGDPFYRDDLAQVVGVADQGSSITVRFVPRIDFLFLEAKRRQPNLKRAEYYKAKGRANRPPQKLFHPHEVRGYGVQLERKRVGLSGIQPKFFHEFLGGRFRGGFQYRQVATHALEIEGVTPTQEEREMFARRSGEDSDEESEGEGEEKKAEDEALAEEEAEAARVAAAGRARRVHYSIGDRVQILTGQARNVTGRVVSVGKETLSIAPDAHLSSLLRHATLEETPHNVRKYFTLGAHVKVVGGVHKGETGMVCNVPDEADQPLSIYTDLSARTLDVSAQDVIESAEVASGSDAFGAYALGDLVELTDNQVGMVVAVHMASLSVMTTKGSVQSVRLQQLRRKRHTDRFSRTNDRNRQPVNRDDKVVVLAGPERGKRATVRHVFQGHLFLHSPDVSEHGGHFVERGNQVALVGALPLSRPAAPRSPGGGARSPGAAPSSPRHAGAMGAPQQRGWGRDPIVGKDVKITGGEYKGLVGFCKDVLESGMARVELRALFRTISVPRAQIMEAVVAPTRAAAAASYMGSQTPFLGGATPAHPGLGGATPHHEGFGSMTPAHLGSRTPLAGSRTPGRDDVWAAQTPAHRGAGGAQVEEDEDEWRREMGLESSSSVSSAAAASQPLTPGMPPLTPRTPATPGSDPYANAPVTPATPYDSGMGDEGVGASGAAGVFTHPSLIGAHVRMSDGRTGTIRSILRDGTVKVAPHDDSPTQSVPHSSLHPVRVSATDHVAVFLRRVEVGGASYAPGQRVKVETTHGDTVVVNRSGTLDMIQDDALCKCDPLDDEDEQEEAASKKGKKKADSRRK